MRRLLSIGFALVPALCQAETLTILNWEEYLSEDTISAWEAKTGHTLRQIYFDNDEARDTLLVRTEQTNIDIAVMDEPGSRILGGSGKFVPTKQYTNVDNLKHIDPFWRDRCGDYSTPYLWGTFGLVYRTDIYQEAPTSWKAITEPDSQTKGHFSILKDTIDTFAPALLAAGYSVNTADESQLKEAYDSTRRIVPHLLTFDYPITYVASSDDASALRLGVAYSGDQWAMNELSDSEHWAYTVPEEGTILWVDCLAVLSNSPRKEIAYDFLNFISQPEIAAANSEELYVATTSGEAKRLQSEEMRSDPTIYPPEEILKKSHYYEPVSTDNFQLRNRMTSALLKLHESQ